MVLRERDDAMKSMIEQFADFVASKPADEEYTYSDNYGCAFCQFLDWSGIKHDGVGGDYWSGGDGAEHPMDFRLHRSLSSRPHTFGALAERLRTATEQAK
jgi:hypothetical protein